MSEIRQRVGDNGLDVELDPKAREWLARIGYDPAFGARPLRRALQKYIESPISVRWLSGNLKKGDKIRIVKKECAEELDFIPA
ncbi:MAG: hypothetical protein AB9907_09100 [Flexilinea sp.]